MQRNLQSYRIEIRCMGIFTHAAEDLHERWWCLAAFGGNLKSRESRFWRSFPRLHVVTDGRRKLSVVTGAAGKRSAVPHFYPVLTINRNKSIFFWIRTRTI